MIQQNLSVSANVQSSGGSLLVEAQKVQERQGRAGRAVERPAEEAREPRGVDVKISPEAAALNQGRTNQLSSMKIQEPAQKPKEQMDLAAPPSRGENNLDVAQKSMNETKPAERYVQKVYQGLSSAGSSEQGKSIKV